MLLHERLSEIENKVAARVSAAAIGFRTSTPGGDTSYESIGISDGTERFRDDGTGLEVSCAVERLHEAIVLHSTIRNTSDAPVTLDILAPLHMVIEHAPRDCVHYHAHGGITDYQLPTSAYAVKRTFELTPLLQLQSHPLGRSSNEDLPLLISVAESLNAGFFCGLEWSATWTFFVLASDDTLVLTAAPKTYGLQLDAGESLPLPPAHLGFFAGDFDAGTNALRRHIYKHVCPAYGGKPTLPKVSYDHWFGLENLNSVEMMMRQADRAAELGCEVFSHDAAWFAGDFPHGVGNWDTVDPEKFPDGLAPLADYVRSLGMEFGLWFEIERAEPGTTAVVQHPEFFFETRQFGHGPWERKQYHLDLSRRDAQDWVIETIDGWVRRLDLRWSRWDYNTEPIPFWDVADPSGKIQYSYMNGLYRCLDVLMKEHPNWMVEQCASGGRRIDLGTIRRAHTLWFSDHTELPSCCRHMQARANRFLPGHLLNSSRSRTSTVTKATATPPPEPHAGQAGVRRGCRKLVVGSR
ncbi:MAG: glycoside hydrolase family 36 protein [Planctomycetota bacterium]|nr:glycoside hydrolase family 36 protein [Planctomycetota bacterium]